MRVLVSGLALMLTLLSPTLAAESSEQGKTPEPAASTTDSTHDDMNTVVCKSLGPAIGSHLGNAKLCLTKKKWLEHDALTQDTMNRALNNRTLTGQPGG